MSRENKGHKNLVPMNRRTEEEQRQITQQGGIASGKARRTNKAIKNMLEAMINSPIDPKEAKEIAESYGIDASTLTKETALIHAMINKAINKEDVQAFNSIMDRLHGKPKQEIQQSTQQGQSKVLTVNMVSANS